MKNENAAIALSALTETHAILLRGKNVHNQLCAIRRKSGVLSAPENEQFSLDEDKEGKVSKIKSTVNSKFNVELDASQQSAFGTGSKKALAFYYSLNRAMVSAGGSADVLFAAFRMEAEEKAKAGREKVTA